MVLHVSNLIKYHMKNADLLGGEFFWDTLYVSWIIDILWIVIVSNVSANISDSPKQGR